MISIKQCSHENTETQAGVSAIKPKDGEEVKGFQLTVQVRCRDCGMPFHFPGLPVCGEIAKTPSAINDGTLLVVPMQAGKASIINN